MTADQTWTQTPDRLTWRACKCGLVLTVCRTGLEVSNAIDALPLEHKARGDKISPFAQP